jgi:NADH-quinone oxidoreductase B subunit/NADH/F420H2 dehydrogenase subunit C
MPHEGIILHNTRDFIRDMTKGLRTWGRQKSIWPLVFGIKCCAIEMMSFGASRFDSDRMGVFFRASPRQADLLIIAGPATIKLKDVILRLYEQMPEPRYVIAFGECSICGGPFFDSYTIINGVDQLIPVDIYVPGCPPRPEALIVAIQKLQEKIKEKEGKEVKFERKSRELVMKEVFDSRKVKLWEDTNVPEKGSSPQPITVTLTKPIEQVEAIEANKKGMQATMAEQPIQAKQEAKSEAGKLIKKYMVEDNGNIFYVKPKSIIDVCKALKDAGYEHLSCITAIDWRNMWEIVYHITSYSKKETITIKAQLEYESPEIDSITSIWTGANWHERETFDLMGIKFKGHPDLRRILLPEDFKQHPLKKEVPYGNIS